MEEIKVIPPEGMETVETVENGVKVFRFEKRELPTSMDQVDGRYYSLGNYHKMYSPYRADAIQSLITLLEIRDKWNEGWNPDWDDLNYAPVFYLHEGNWRCSEVRNFGELFHFKTKKLRDKFLETFKDELETVKELFQNSRA